MTLQADMLNDLTTFFADFGISVTYTPAGGVARTITAIFDERMEVQSAEGIPGFSPGITCKTPDVTGLKFNDLFTVDGVDYKSNVDAEGAADGTGMSAIPLRKK